MIGKQAHLHRGRRRRYQRLDLPAATADPPEAGTEPRRYTVDELAVAAGVPSRTIRFYQFKGVLPAPERRGRVALYDERHRERLRLIGELQHRGLSLRAVRHMVRRDSDDARLLSGWIALGENLDKPWSDDQPRTVRQDELEALVGERPPGTLVALVRSGVVERERTGSADQYRIASPGLLGVTLALLDNKVEIETSVRAGEILRGRLRTVARELIDHFANRARRGRGRTADPDEIGAALDALRPIAGDAVRLIFAKEIERVLRERVTPDGRRVRARRRGLARRVRRSG